MKLAYETIFRVFPPFELASGKLPQPCQLFTFRPFAQQNPPIDIDQRTCRDQNKRDLVHQLR